VATPGDSGGSLIQVFHNFTGEYELGLEMELEGTVTTIVPYPTEMKNITVGFADGVIQRYTLWEELEYDVYDPNADKPKETPYPQLIPLILFIGGVVAITMVIHRMQNQVA